MNPRCHTQKLPTFFGGQGSVGRLGWELRATLRSWGCTLKLLLLAFSHKSCFFVFQQMIKGNLSWFVFFNLVKEAWVLKGGGIIVLAQELLEGKSKSL